MTKQWHHFDSPDGLRVSILAIDEKAARNYLRMMLRGFRETDFKLHSATYNRDGSPVL